MPVANFTIRGEVPKDSPYLEILTENVFGPGMRARAAYYLREGVDHEMDLSFVVERSDKVIGTVRLTKVIWGAKYALMLGPLAVLVDWKSCGVGKLLMKTAVEAARKKSHICGAPVILLVGDLDYYSPFGFKPVPPSKISLPRPADPQRILACELVPGSLAEMSGSVTRFSRQ
jgi:predicted N-acetyltransferase YhbS